MKYYFEKARELFLLISAIIIGIFIFISSSAMHINHNIFNPSFHEKLFEKHDIYSGATYLLDNSITKYITYVKNVSPESYTQQKEVFDLLEQTTSKEAVTRSIDYLKDGIYEYFTDERKFLPDITLRASNENSINSTNGDNVFFNISKVNLGAVLMYANRTDIVDYFAIIKLVYYFINKLPNLVLPVLLLFFILSFYLIKDFKQLFKWLTIIFSITTGLFAITSLSIFIYVYFIMPGNIQPITMTLFMDANPVVSYLKDSANPFLIFQAILTLLSFTFAFLFKRLYLKAKPYLKEKITEISDMRIKFYIIIKAGLIILMLILLSSSFYFRLNNIIKDYNDNDFAAVIYKMTGVETMTKVIPAKDSFVHDVLVKVIDEKTGKPIKDLRVDISGKNDENGKGYVDSKVLDENGEAKFNLDKGFFKLSFYSPTFPSKEYKVPGQIFFELDKPGTKILTVNLEPVPVPSQKSGFAEIEILDTNNKPIQGIELQVTSKVDAEGHPDYVSAISNSHGIAVFKLSEGKFKINFNSDKLPQKFAQPEPFTIEVKPEKTSRYTVRMTSN